MIDDSTSSIDRRGFLEATGAAGAAVALGGVASGSSDEESGTTVLVGYDAGTDPDAVRSSLPEDAEVLRHQESLRIFEVRIDREGTYAQTSAAATIASAEPVKYTEASRRWYPLGVSEDARELEGSGAPPDVASADDPGLDRQYAPQQVRADEAWGTSYGSDDVTIAIVDQGVDYTHPDLRDRFGANKGLDFVDREDDPMPPSDDEYHGTHVAGIAAATTNNGTGVAGISNSRLLSCRALSGGIGGGTFAVIDAVRWAADQGVDIINMSLGGGGYSSSFKEAVSYAANRDVLIICAAGNDDKRGVAYPARYDECVAVSAIDSSQSFADFSQYGPEVEVTAPGVDVLSCAPSGDYFRLDGTSMSSPAAAGVAALGFVVDPGLSASEMRQRLKDTAVDVGLSSEQQGAGRVDALQMVGGTGGDPCTAESTQQTSELSGSLSGSGDAATFTHEVGVDSPKSVTVELDAPERADFDLYVTTDGRTPTRADYDHRSGGFGATETVTVPGPGLTSGDTLGIRVDAYTGSGSFTVEVVEAGAIDTECGGDGGDGGTCGSVKDTSETSGRLREAGEYHRYYYRPQLDDPCQVTFDLGGPVDADFELYVEDSSGMKRSETSNSIEKIVVTDADPDEIQWVYIYNRSGSGAYLLEVEELGK